MNRRQLLAGLGGFVVMFATSLAAQDAKFVYVIGFVPRPGKYQFTGEITVREAIAMAGGLRDDGAARGIEIIRVVDGKNVSVTVGMDDNVLSGDTIRVPRRAQP